MRTANPDSPTKERLLNSAQQLMLDKGYGATTVDEICGAAEVTKGSFFHYFKSKEQLGKALLDRFSVQSCKRMEEVLSKAGDDPLDRIYSLIDSFAEMAKQSGRVGCLVGTFSQEISNTHPALRAVCEESFKKVAEILKEDLARARALHAPKAAFDVNSLAEHFITVTQGSLILAKAKGDNEVLAKSLAHFRAYVKCLFVT